MPGLQVSSGAAREVLRPGPDAVLGLVEVAGPAKVSAQGCWAWLIVESGSGQLSLAGRAREVSGRADVFAGAGWSALVAPGDLLEVSGDALRCSIFWRPAVGSPDGGPSRLIDPADVSDEARGSGATRRQVRTYLTDGPFIAGETVNPPGGWSSWPPHRHDLDSQDPAVPESDHEEVYAYRFSPGDGFGVHVAYALPGAGDADPIVVRQGDAVRITSGYHPVVAAPGVAMCYLWALAGARPVSMSAQDPVYAD